MINILKRRSVALAIITGGVATGLLAQSKIKNNQLATPQGGNPNQLVEKSIVLNGNSVVGAGGVISLPETPAANTITWVMRNGLVQAENFDYSISTSKITFLFPALLATDDTFVVRYKV